MSIAATAIAEAPIAGQTPASPARKPPRNRQTVAKADTVAQPEPR